jgi:TonB family protein
VASGPSASRNPAIATSAAATAASPARPAADITAITTRDDFLLELGEALAGKAAVRPVDSLEAALEGMTGARIAQVLVIDAREVADVRAALQAVHTSGTRPTVLVFAEGEAEKALGTALKGTEVFAVLPLPFDAPKTVAVLEGAIAEAFARRAAAASARTAPSASGPHAVAASRAVGASHGIAPPDAMPVSRADAASSAPRPMSVARAAEPAVSRAFPARMVVVAGFGVLALIAAGAFWFFAQGSHAPAASSAPSATNTGNRSQTAVAPVVAETSLLQGKVDELLEKARLAMHERRFSEPAGDNALLYYRSAAAADPGNAEARDGLQRVAGALAGRFEEALNGARLDEAVATLASFKSVAPGDARIAPYEQRLYTAQITRAIVDGNLERAAAVVHQAQVSGVVAAEQITRWRADIGRRQEDARVQRLADLIDERIRDGRLVEADDSASTYLQQLETTAPANAATQRAEHDFVNACLRKAREAALAKNSTEEDRWVSAARAAGAKAADISAFQKELAGAQAKAAQAESERLLRLARERLHEGRLTDPAQDSAAGYLTQAQASDPSNAALAVAAHELAKALLDRARAAVLAGKSGDSDLAQAKRWGADPADLAAVTQLQPGAKPAPVDTAALAAKLKQLRAVPPDYPPNALKQQLTGSVMVEYVVDARGETRDIHVVESNPPQVFDQAAINAVRHWRYAPMIVNGSAVEVPAKARMRFELPK